MAEVVEQSREAHTLAKLGAAGLGQGMLTKGEVKRLPCEVHHPDAVQEPRVGRAWERPLREAHLLDAAQADERGVVDEGLFSPAEGDGPEDWVADFHAPPLNRARRGALAPEVAGGA